MDPGKEDADVKTAPAPEAPARPAPGAVPSAEPLHGPVDAAEDSLDGLQTAFGALSVEEVVSQPQPVKRKRERTRARRMLEEEQTKERSKGKTRRMSLPSKAHQALLASTHHPLL